MPSCISKEASQKSFTPVGQGHVFKRDDNVKDDHCFYLINLIIKKKPEIKIKINVTEKVVLLLNHLIHSFLPNI